MATSTNSEGDSATSRAVRVRFDAFELDEANACLLRDGKPVALAPKPLAVLCVLARQPGSLVTKNALLDEVWGHQFVSESVLKTIISELRTVFHDDVRQPRFIETVSRRGYRFVAKTIPAASPVRGNFSTTRPQDASAFIGRADELSRLRHAWEAACRGERAVVWVAGEPGIGKTMLIERFIAGLGDIACARGQCVEHYGTGEPYLPVLEALAQLCRSESTVPDLLRAVAPTWLLQLPWLSTAEERDALRRELAGVSPQRMLREMGEVLDRYTERQPLLLVTEDLHWSDRPTIELIDHIARRRGGARLMWLASFRSAEVIALDHPLNSLRRELRLHRLCEEIALDPFSETEIAEYVAQRSSSLASDEAFVRALQERTDGVPLFVTSVLSDVVARATQGDDDASRAQLANVAVPENLAAIIDHYIARLGNEQRLLLSAAAACDVEFRVGTISKVLERDPAWVGQTCDDLAREQLWLTAPRAEEGNGAVERPYSFRHTLFRQVLYERTAPSARARLHARVGAALEAERAAGTPVAAAELAMHFERGREPMNALRCYADAAKTALARLSPAECMSLTEHALALLAQTPKGNERNVQEFTLATLRGVSAAQARGFGSEAKNAFQRAYALLGDVPQHPMRRLLLHGFGFVLSQRAEYAEALAVAERAEALASATNDPILALAVCTVQGHAQMLQGRPRDARTWLVRGLALLESLDAPAEQITVTDPQVLVLGLLGIQLLHLGLVEQARARLQQARARSLSLGQPMARMVAIWCDALVEVRLGNAQRVAALADEMRALVEEFALAQGRAACRWFRGWADARLGKPLEGYRKIREAHEENTRLGMLAGGSENLGYAAEALLLAADWDATEQQLQEALQHADKYGERIYLPQLFLVEAAIARGRGDSTGARASVRRALAEAHAQEAPWLELLALVELCEGKRVTAEDRQTLAALVDQLPEAKGTAVLEKARALIGRPKRA